MKIQSLNQSALSVSKNTVLIDRGKNQSATIRVRKGAGLMYFCVNGLVKGSDIRRTITLADGSSAMVHAIAIGKNAETLLTDIRVVHQGKNTTSRVIMRGVFGGSSRGVLNGTIHIAKQGHGGDARVDERILIISDAAQAEAVPNLEIEADDVTASHAATVSKLSEEEIFYLMTRSIPRGKAIRLMIAKFLGDQLTHLPESKERTRLEADLNKSLQKII